MEGFNPSMNIPPMSFITNTMGASSSSGGSGSGSGSGGGMNISSSSLVTTSTNRRMDSRIWSRLPQTLIDRVIAFLPPPAFFRARSVCKRWYNLLFSDSFLEMYLNIPRRHHWFLFFNHRSLKSKTYKNNNGGQLDHHDGNHHKQQDNNICEGYLFDPNEITWYRLSFAYIPSGFSPASSSGGLMCWVTEISGNTKSLILCNPLQKIVTQLPPTQKPRLCPSIGVAITHSSFYVVVAGDDMISPHNVKNISSETFHVDTGGYCSIWGTTCALLKSCNFESERMVFLQGKLYCLSYRPFKVHSYDVGRNEWCEMEPPMKRFLRSPSLLECRGRLVFVAAVDKSKLKDPKSLRLWSLVTRESKYEWKEADKMPQQLYDQFMEAEGGKGFDCVGNGNYVIITILGSDMMVLYNFYQKGWQWIPRCPFIRRHGGGVGGADGNGLHGFAYEPQLVSPIMGLLTHSSLPYQSNF